MKYIILILCLFSCKDSYEIKEEMANLIYNANSFFTNQSGLLVPRNNWTGEVKFTESCRYITDDPDNQGDWIKLWGIRKNIYPWDLYKNGIYLVWSYKPSTDKIRMYYYLHDKDGNHSLGIPPDVVTVNIGSWINIDVANYKENFVVHIGESSWNIDKTSNNILDFKQGYSLQPWGGGSETIPHQRVVEFNKF